MGGWGGVGWGGRAEALCLLLPICSQSHSLTLKRPPALQAGVYDDLVKYLLMVRKKVKDPKVDTELVYAYAQVQRGPCLQRALCVRGLFAAPASNWHAIAQL